MNVRSTSANVGPNFNRDLAPSLVAVGPKLVGCGPSVWSMMCKCKSTFLELGPNSVEIGPTLVERLGVSAYDFIVKTSERPCHPLLGIGMVSAYRATETRSDVVRSEPASLLKRRPHKAAIFVLIALLSHDVAACVEPSATMQQCAVALYLAYTSLLNIRSNYHRSASPCGPNLPEIRGHLVEIGPISVDSALIFVEVCQFRPNIGRARPKLTESVPPNATLATAIASDCSKPRNRAPPSFASCNDNACPTCGLAPIHTCQVPGRLQPSG